MALQFPIDYGQSIIKSNIIITHSDVSKVILIIHLEQLLIFITKRFIAKCGLALLEEIDMSHLLLGNQFSLFTNNMRFFKLQVYSPQITGDHITEFIETNMITSKR